jgi:hydrogenase nickel incorporation protein HypB
MTMCNTCGCNITDDNKQLLVENLSDAADHSGRKVVDVLQSLLSDNERQAQHNRDHFNSHQVLVINLMSSPGAGKTALLEASLDILKDQYRIAVIEGDLETENDAERIRAKGIVAVQITTGSACHLDAHMVHNAIHQLNLTNLDIVFIENVGNLVCPASFDLGQHQNVVLLSTPEGDDKPAKYPVMFRVADLLLISKSDLLPILDDFDPLRVKHYLHQLANPATVLQLSAKSSAGMSAWIAWLQSVQQKFLQKYAAKDHSSEKNENTCLQKNITDLIQTINST